MKIGYISCCTSSCNSTLKNDLRRNKIHIIIENKYNLIVHDGGL